MNESKTVNHASIHEALVAAQAEFTPVAKDRENPYFKSEYATLLAVMAMVRPVLARHGLGYSQQVKDGCMVTQLIHVSGQTLESQVPFSCADTKPQGVGSALTYFRRYGLQAALGVVVCDGSDDDGNAAMGLAAKPAVTGGTPNAAKTAKPVDYGICPCGSVKGKAWGEIEPETLKKILALPAGRVKQITPEHRKAALAALESKAKAAKAEGKATIEELM